MADEGQQLPDYYALLGIGFDASDDELRRAWREAVKRWHPDTNRSPDAHRMMASVNKAWEVLGNPERKARYDKEFHQRQTGATGQNSRRSRRAERDRPHNQRQAGKTGQGSGTGQGGSRRQREDRKTRRERERRGRKSREEEERRRHTEEDLRRREEELRRREEEMFNRANEERRARERKRRIQEQRDEAARQRENLRRSQRSGPGFISRHYRCVGWVVLMSLMGIVWLVTTYGEEWANQLRSLGGEITSINQTSAPVLAATPTPPAPAVTPILRSAYSVLPTPDTTPAVEPNEIATRAFWSALRRRETHDEIVNLISLGADVSATEYGQTAFEYAIEFGLQSSIVQLVSAGVTPSESTESLWTVMSKGGCPDHDLILYLISLGADVTATRSGRTTMFEVAMFKNCGDSTVQLFSAVLSIDAATRGLWAALQRGTTPVEVEHYTGFGADVTAINSNGRTMLEYASARGYGTPILQSLSDGSSVETLTNALWTALRGATTPAEVAELIRRGADVSGPDGSYAMFQYVVRTEASDSIVHLLSDGVSIEAATAALWNKLGRTDNRPTIDEILYLVSLGADVSALNSIGETMFEYAIRQIHEPSVIQLLSAGLSFEAATDALWSALVKGATPEEVEYYVCQGADVVEPNSSLETMLYYAEARGYAADVLDALKTDCDSPRPMPDAPVAPFLPELTAQGPGSETISGHSTHDLTSIGGSISLSSGWRNCLLSFRSSQRRAIAPSAKSGGIEFSFGVPPASDWSIGLVYHADNPHGGSLYDQTVTYLFSSVDGIWATHRTEDGYNYSYQVEPIAIAGVSFDGSAGAVNKFAIRTDRSGTELELNGTLVLSVPGHQLRPRRGSMMICAGAMTDEPEEYTIEVVGLRAWTDEAWR